MGYSVCKLVIPMQVVNQNMPDPVAPFVFSCGDDR
jgi:hypothetical protein